MVNTDMIRRLAVGSNAVVATATWVDITVTIPVDVTRGLAILIWGWDIEFSDVVDADGQIFEAILSRNTVTAEMYVSNQDVIDKIKWSFEIVTSGGGPTNWLDHRDLYPAIPYMSNQIHFGVYQTSGGSVSAHVRLWYSTAFINQREAMGMLSNFGVP